MAQTQDDVVPSCDTLEVVVSAMIYEKLNIYKDMFLTLQLSFFFIKLHVLEEAFFARYLLKSYSAVITRPEVLMIDVL